MNRAPPKTATPGAIPQPIMPREKMIAPRNSSLREPSRVTRAAAAAAPSIMPTATKASGGAGGTGCHAHRLVGEQGRHGGAVAGKVVAFQGGERAGQDERASVRALDGAVSRGCWILGASLTSGSWGEWSGET